MRLPTVNKKKLQATVFQLEMRGPLATYTALCQAIANTEFGRVNTLSPEVVANLLFEHGIICKTAMPDPDELPSLEPKKPEPKKVVDTSPTLPKVVDTSPTLPKVVDIDPTLPKVEAPVGSIDRIKQLREEQGLSLADAKKVLHAENGVDTDKVQDRLADELESLDSLYDEPPPPPPKPKTEAKPVVKRGRKPKEQEQESGLDLDSTSRPVMDDRLLKIAFPQGPSPAKLTDLDPLTVLDWMDKVRSAGMKQGRWYLESAFRYFARESYDINGPQWPEVCDLIREAYQQ